MKQNRPKSAKFFCGACGSTDIATAQWVSLGTNQMVLTDAIFNYFFCPACDETKYEVCYGQWNACLEHKGDPVGKFCGPRRKRKVKK
jgi:hypothetical protein